MDKVTDFTEEQEITGGLLPAPAMEEGGSTHFFYVPNILVTWIMCLLQPAARMAGNLKIKCRRHVKYGPYSCSETVDNA